MFVLFRTVFYPDPRRLLATGVIKSVIGITQQQASPFKILLLMTVQLSETEKWGGGEKTKQKYSSS